VNPVPELVALRKYLAQLPRLTEVDQTQLLVDLISAETSWRSELISAHGLTAFERLERLPSLLHMRPLFRTREVQQQALYDHVHAKRWTELAKVPVNYRFLTWSRPHALPTRSMRRLEGEIVAIRQRLVESVLALILKQSAAFKKGSKTQVAEIADLVALGVEGALEATDKYASDVPSARVWKSTVLGRMSGAHTKFANAQAVAHLWPKDERRLVNLRAGRVEKPTDDDLQLLGIGDVTSIAPTSSSFDDNGNLAEFDPADPGLSPEDILIAREEWAQREAAQPRLPVPTKRRARPGVPVRDVDTGAVFSSVTEAASAFGTTPANVCAAIKRGRPCKGRRLERVA
jgi:hypothetical protein